MKIQIDIIIFFVDRGIFTSSFLVILFDENLFSNIVKRTIGEASQSPIILSEMKLVEVDITSDSIIPINHKIPTDNPNINAFLLLLHIGGIFLHIKYHRVTAEKAIIIHKNEAPIVPICLLITLGLLCALALKENHLLYKWWACGYTVKKFLIFSKGLVLA